MPRGGEGLIRHVRKKNNRFLTGVKFIHIKPDDQKILDQYLETNEEASDIPE